MDDQAQVGDHIQVLGFISFLDRRGKIYRSAVGECEVYLCEKLRAGFWRARANWIMGNPEVIVHRTAFNGVVLGVKSFEMKLTKVDDQCGKPADSMGVDTH